VNSSIVDTRSIGANNIESYGNSIPRPHGGKLINKFTTRKNIDGLFSIEVSIDLLNDIENIADGTFSPLEGFMGQEDFESVVESGRLKNGLAWTIPIVLDVNDKMAAEIKDSGEDKLKNNDDHFAVLNFEEA
jgi:sulfate adenylyltransferase